MSRQTMAKKLNLTPADFGVEDLQKKYTKLVQNYMDKIVQAKGYDDVFTCISYVDSTDEIFRREALAVLAWRDKVWRMCYDVLAEVNAGRRAVPSESELLAMLPKLEW
nr:hypothetical protein [Phascolarctobacterium succinatutens]